MVVGVDEVGRGALAGPLVVGAVVVEASCRATPTGLRDSKLLAPERRQRLVPVIRRWATAVSIGQCSAEEIDAFGVSSALRTAALRALAALPYQSMSMVLLDGSVQFLAPGEHVIDGQSVSIEQSRCTPRADNTWSSVAAASVVAKVARDRHMTDLSHRFGGYAWHQNKGYATAEHMAALRNLGPCQQHRLSWRLPQDSTADFAMME
jgi:ribonuclease HII